MEGPSPFLTLISSFIIGKKLGHRWSSTGNLALCTAAYTCPHSAPNASLRNCVIQLYELFRPTLNSCNITSLFECKFSVLLRSSIACLSFISARLQPRVHSLWTFWAERCNSYGFFKRHVSIAKIRLLSRGWWGGPVCCMKGLGVDGDARPTQICSYSTVVLRACLHIPY